MVITAMGSLSWLIRTQLVAAHPPTSKVDAGDLSCAPSAGWVDGMKNTDDQVAFGSGMS